MSGFTVKQPRTAVLDKDAEPDIGELCFNRFGGNHYRNDDGMWYSYRDTKIYTWDKLWKKLGPLMETVWVDVEVEVPTDEEVASGFARGGNFKVEGAMADMSMRREGFRLWLEKHDQAVRSATIDEYQA